MNRKLTIVLAILVILALISGLSFFLMSRMDYFRLTEIDIVYDKPVNGISSDALELIKQYSGKSIFDVHTEKFTRNILQTPCVKSVHVTKSYPDQLVVEINYQSYQCRLFAQTTDGYEYYLASHEGITTVNEEIYGLYSSLTDVEITAEYGAMLMRWGVDSGLLQMLKLATVICENNLITGVKYDNNKGSDFGHMNFTIPELDVCVSVREPITPDTLQQGIDLLFAADRNEIVRQYDLYASGLFGRN